MPINDKPFDEADKIAKRIWRERPNVFSAQDLNQQIDIFDNELRRLSENVGMMRYNWKVNLMLDDSSVVGTQNKYNSQISLLKVVNDQPAYVYFKGIRFEIPVGDQKTYSGTWLVDQPNYPIGYVVLIATKKTVTFADNQVIAGITASTKPNAVPSSDAVQYSGERLVYVKSTADVGGMLGLNEEMIGIIASVGLQDDGIVNVKSTTTSNDITTTTVVYTEGVSRKVLYHAIVADELMDWLDFSKGDDILNELKLISSTVNEQQIENNGSLNEAFIFLRDFIGRKLKYMVQGFRAMQGKLDIASSTLTTMQNLINVINDAVNNLKKLREVAVGMVVEWEGDMSYFDVKGTGKTGTPVEGFQIMNGYGGTTDRRGRFPVMALQVPNEGAPNLADAVNPSNPAFAGGVIPNYAPGDVGGEAAHKLTTQELPRVDLTYSKPKLQANSDAGGTPDYVAVEDGHLIFGGDVPHNNLPPFFATVWIKRVK